MQHRRGHLDEEVAVLLPELVPLRQQIDRAQITPVQVGDEETGRNGIAVAVQISIEVHLAPGLVEHRIGAGREQRAGVAVGGKLLDLLEGAVHSRVLDRAVGVHLADKPLAVAGPDGASIDLAQQSGAFPAILDYPEIALDRAVRRDPQVDDQQGVAARRRVFLARHRDQIVADEARALAIQPDLSPDRPALVDQIEGLSLAGLAAGEFVGFPRMCRLDCAAGGVGRLVDGNVMPQDDGVCRDCPSGHPSPYKQEENDRPQRASWLDHGSVSTIS